MEPLLVIGLRPLLIISKRSTVLIGRSLEGEVKSGDPPLSGGITSALGRAARARGPKHDANQQHPGSS